jgi:hypothetical protein
MILPIPRGLLTLKVQAMMNESLENIYTCYHWYIVCWSIGKKVSADQLTNGLS